MKIGKGQGKGTRLPKIGQGTSHHYHEGLHNQWCPPRLVLLKRVDLMRMWAGLLMDSVEVRENSAEIRITQEQLDKERERDETIKKMLAQMELLEDHVLENVKKHKGTSGVFRVEEGSSSGYSKPGENQSWNSKKYEEGFHPCYLQRGGNQGWNFHKEEEQRRYYQEWAEKSDYWRKEDEHDEDHTQSSESPKSERSASSPRVNDLLSRILDKVEGLDNLLKGMKDDLSSLNNRVNSHADEIKLLEGQLSLLSAQLKPNMMRENGDRGLAVVTRSGKVVVGDATCNDEEKIYDEDKLSRSPSVLPAIWSSFVDAIVVTPNGNIVH
uniref:Integrase core domain containing protein n=1 Tax=Solanum tuberosum TaxID=4113 RepID=M1DE86_SOLTU